MKIYVIQDEEGVSGVVRWERDLEAAGSDLLHEARLTMTREVNAAVDGALEGGATEVLVHESHPFVYSELHPEAKCVKGAWLPLIDESTDGVFMVGQHSRARTPKGVLAHSYSSLAIRQMLLNGKPIGEIGFTAVLAGQHGVPVALVTGDRAATEEARDLLGDVEVVAVKEGLGICSAVCLSAARAEALIREKAKAAMGRLQDFTPLRIGPPYALTIDFNQPQVAERCEFFPGVRRLDATTVEFSAESFLDIARFRKFQALVNIV